MKRTMAVLAGLLLAGRAHGGTIAEARAQGLRFRGHGRDLGRRPRRPDLAGIPRIRAGPPLDDRGRQRGRRRASSRPGRPRSWSTIPTGACATSFPTSSTPRASLISGSPKPLSMMQGIGESFQACLFIGYHAKAGTEAAILDHTISGSVVQAIRINGIEMPELGINAAIAGYFGVPVVMVSGDTALCAQAKAMLGPGTVGRPRQGGLRTIRGPPLPQGRGPQGAPGRGPGGPAPARGGEGLQDRAARAGSRSRSRPAARPRCRCSCRRSPGWTPGRRSFRRTITSRGSS